MKRAEASEGRSDNQWFALRFLAASRTVVALLLLTPAGLGLQVEIFDSARDRTRFLWLALAYSVLALVYLVIVAVTRRRFYLQLLVHGISDVTALTLMSHFAGALHGGLDMLIVAAVAGVAVLATPALAGFFAALAALSMLLESAWRVIVPPGGEASTFLQTGLFGAACFVAAYLINRLASRLEREERLARQRGEDLRNQLGITQLVIAELHHGVIVVSRQGVLLTMNRAAALLLGDAVKVGDALLAPPAPALPETTLPLHVGAGRALQAAEQIGAALAQWQRAPTSESSAHELLLQGPTGQPAIRVRVRFLRARPESGDVVLVIESLRNVEERAQQLKLASMGRLTASIAHEIRNPLAAIRHANSLLAEQLDDGALQRMARIVETNTVRINRIVEDVLSISRREPPAIEAIDLQHFLPAFIAEYVASSGAHPRADRIVLALTSPAPMWFDPHHLRQILVNLLGNALRYASDLPGAIRIEWRRLVDDRLELAIADDGPGLAPEVLQHLFEPFFTTEARGTGLGLYLARELCHANGAGIRSESRPADSRYPGEFVIEPRPRVPPSLLAGSDDRALEQNASGPAAATGLIAAGAAPADSARNVVAPSAQSAATQPSSPAPLRTIAGQAHSKATNE